MTALDLSRIPPGFADPVPAAQATFRALLDAMSRPGGIATAAALAPAGLPLPPAALAVALTLCDADTPVWLDAAAGAAAGFIRFHCGAPVVEDPGRCRFAFAADPAGLPPLDRFDLGTDAAPDASTTLVLAVAGLGRGARIALAGAGIDGRAELAVDGLPAAFWDQRRRATSVFPRGLDIVLAAGDRLAALPRTTEAVPCT